MPGEISDGQMGNAGEVNDPAESGLGIRPGEESYTVDPDKARNRAEVEDDLRTSASLMRRGAEAHEIRMDSTIIHSGSSAEDKQHLKTPNDLGRKQES